MRTQQRIEKQTIIKCEQCGADIVLAPDTRAVQCSQCGATVTSDAALNKALQQTLQTTSRYPNPTPLRPGMRGRFLGRNYTIMGRVVLGMREEGETYYWHEFQLVAPDGDVLYLEFDEGQWKWMRPFIPRQPIGPLEAVKLRAGARLALDDNTVLVTENSTSTVYFVEGDLTYEANVDDRVDYLDAGFGNRLYSVQWSADEIEFYKGQALSEREVLAAFSLQEQLAALDARETKRRSRNIFATVCLLCSIVSLLMWAGAQSSGHVVNNGSVPLNAVGSEGVRFGPFKLDPAMRVHRLTIRGSMRQASAWVSGVVEAADGTELLDTQHDFWDESGYDDGPWHEWDLQAHSDFVVKQPGPYYVRLYVERDTPGGTYQDVGYELRGGVTYPRYYGIYGIIAFLTALVFYCIANQEGLKKLNQQMSESSGDD